MHRLAVIENSYSDVCYLLHSLKVVKSVGRNKNTRHLSLCWTVHMAGVRKLKKMPADAPSDCYWLGKEAVPPGPFLKDEAPG